MSNQRGGPADGADANGAHRPVSLTLVPKAAERQSTKEFKSDQEVRWCPGCGNHLIHALRRNVNVKILLFNNRIYGLTKGQYSPTSEQGKVTKSTPFGSLDTPFNPVSLALGAEASFVARTIDSDRKHLTGVLRAAADHRGAAFIEIYQNCPIFNDDAFAPVTDAASRDDRLIKLEHGEPVRFAGGTRGLRFGPHGDLEAVEVAVAEGLGKSDAA